MAKKWYKRWWMIIIYCFVVLMIIGSLMPEETKPSKTQSLKLIENTGEISGYEYDIIDMPISLKKEIVDELEKIQDEILFEDVNYAKKMENTWTIIANKYSITESQLNDIVVESIDEGW